MEQNQRLGLYLGTDHGAAVLLSPQHGRPAVTDVLTVHLESTPEAPLPPGSIAAELGRQVRDRGWKYEEAFVALDSGRYTQHQFRSPFNEPRQIANTIKFDVEEIVAGDATRLAVTFLINDTFDDGAAVTVFSAQREELSASLSALQSAGIDPVVIEPDIVPLARLLLTEEVPAEDEAATLHVVLSDNRCYMISRFPSHPMPRVRSFLVSSSQDLNGVLAREVPLTIAAQNLDDPVRTVFLAGRAEEVDASALAERISIDVQRLPVEQLIDNEQLTSSQLPAASELAAACGAALVGFGRIRAVDFRDDFSPYLGRKVVIRRMSAVISAAVSIVLLVLIGMLHGHMQQPQQNVADLHDRFAADYKAVMNGQKYESSRIKTGRDKLERVLRGLQNSGVYGGDDSSVPSKLLFILTAFNEAMGDPDKPENRIGLTVNAVTVSDSTIRVQGETNGRNDTLTLLAALDNHPRIRKESENLQEKGNRDVFIVNLALED